MRASASTETHPWVREDDLSPIPISEAVKAGPLARTPRRGPLGLMSHGAASVTRRSPGREASNAGAVPDFFPPTGLTYPPTDG